MKRKVIKIIGSILIGIAITFLSFVIFIVFSFFAQRDILFPILGVFFVSIIVFLVLWNIINKKFVYLILLIPVICIAASVSVFRYYFYVDEIPIVRQDIDLGSYIPFATYSSLAILDGESTLKLIDNLPILDGATALYPIYASFAQAVYPKGDYSYYTSDNNYQFFRERELNLILCNMTNGAYDNLFEGTVDIIFCAEPSESQLRRFTENNIKLNFTAIGREAFVFFVNNTNPVSNLAIQDIQDIYSGRIKNWKKLNGLNQRIRAFQRPENSGSQTMLIKMMGDNSIIKPRRENISLGMGSVINQVADYRNFSNAIGYSFLFFSTQMAANDQIKLLFINGIYPSIETIQNNSYPFSESFYAIYVENDNKNENIEKFIEWILSEQGQTLVQRTGYVPINRY